MVAPAARLHLCDGISATRVRRCSAQVVADLHNYAKRDHSVMERQHLKDVSPEEAGEAVSRIAGPAGGQGAAAHVLQLQRLIGNRAVGRVLAAGGDALRSRRRIARVEADPFADDPRGDVQDDGSIGVKPGPMRTTLLATERLKRKRDGSTFMVKNTRAIGWDPGLWAQNFLSFFNFHLGFTYDTGSEKGYFFNEGLHTLTWILDAMMQEAAFDQVALTRELALAEVTVRLPTSPPGPGPTRTQVYLSFSVTEVVHANPKTPLKTGTPDPVGEQLGIQYTLELHPENKSGRELSWVTQLGWSKDPDRQGELEVQQILTGPQAAYVWAFLDGSLQVTVIAQALTGFLRGEGRKDRIVKLHPATQVGAGGQLVWVVPNTGEHLQVGGQAAASWSDPDDVDSTIDYGTQIFLQWKF